MPFGRAVALLLTWETCEEKSVLRARNGTAHVRQARLVVASSFSEDYVENVAIEVIGQDRSSNVVACAFSQELGAWEGGLELPHDHGLSLRQEMRDACWESSVSMSSPRSLCSVCLEEGVLMPWFLQCCERMKAKERECGALFSGVGGLVSFQFLMFKHGVPVE